MIVCSYESQVDVRHISGLMQDGMLGILEIVDLSPATGEYDGGVLIVEASPSK